MGRDNEGEGRQGEFLDLPSCWREGVPVRDFFLRNLGLRPYRPECARSRLRNLGQHIPLQGKTFQFCLYSKKSNLKIPYHFIEIWLHPNLAVWIFPQILADSNREVACH